MATQPLNESKVTTFPSDLMNANASTNSRVTPQSQPNQNNSSDPSTVVPPSTSSGPHMAT